HCGGIAIVQNPDDAAFPNMVDYAIENCNVDYVLSVNQISEFLNKLGAASPVLPETSAERNRAVSAIADPGQAGTAMTPLGLGGASDFGCPACGGVLWKVAQEELDTFKCRVGHAYGTHALLSAQDQSVEEALWSAVRALEEKSSLSTRLAKRLHKTFSANRL